MNASGGVDGQGPDEVAVDEDVAGGPGDGGECWLAVVGGAEADLVFAADGELAVDHCSPVDGGRGPEGSVGGAALGCLFPCLIFLLLFEQQLS